MITPHRKKHGCNYLSMSVNFFFSKRGPKHVYTGSFWHPIAHSILLTHWGRVTHICVGKLTIIGSDNGLSPGRRQAIIWTNAGILLIEHLGTNFSEILFHSRKCIRKWRPFFLGLNVLISCLQTLLNYIKMLRHIYFVSYRPVDKNIHTNTFLHIILIKKTHFFTLYL